MWKDYPKNTDYCVSDDGRIYSKKVKKELSPKKNWDGYERVQIWEHGKCRFVSWHRVVAETWCEKPEGATVVNHKDGNKQNNHSRNLEWVTQKENIQHAWETGLSTHKNHSKLGGVAQYSIDGKLIAVFDCIADAAKETGINYHSIYGSAKKQMKARRNYYWRFLENSNDYPEREYTVY